MIFIITGGVGSGKSLSVVKLIADNPKMKFFVNFRCKLHNAVRLTYSDIIIPAKDKKDKPKINWTFWNEQKKDKFCIILDEAHNVFNARESMSRKNIMLSNFISQIRKVLSDNLDSHLYIISQKLRKIDVNARDLAHSIIDCRIVKRGKNVYVCQFFYLDEDMLNIRKPYIKKYFLGNTYFKFYDSKELISFGDEDEGGYI